MDPKPTTTKGIEDIIKYLKSVTAWIWRNMQENTKKKLPFL